MSAAPPKAPKTALPTKKAEVRSDHIKKVAISFGAFIAIIMGLIIVHGLTRPKQNFKLGEGVATKAAAPDETQWKSTFNQQLSSYRAQAAATDQTTQPPGAAQPAAAAEKVAPRPRRSNADEEFIRDGLRGNMAVHNVGGLIAPLASSAPSPASPTPALNPATGQRLETLKDRLDAIRRQRDTTGPGANQ
ncbi:MAG TPA: hypothetical protein VGU69_10415 [Rhizomicrobium sp.]|nr:hypothetical protein [Rhizomicrobium sp.]